MVEPGDLGKVFTHNPGRGPGPDRSGLGRANGALYGLPPIPIEVLGTAKGQMYAPEELARHFSQALFPRTTNRYGCVTLHSYHFYIEEGLPHCGRERVSLLVDFTRTLSARGQLNVLPALAADERGAVYCLVFSELSDDVAEVSSQAA
jgi:hypothetical protein